MATILVVEDEAGVRFMLRELLEEEGHRVLQAEHGEQALQRLEGVELVLTDLVMPQLDGMGLLRELSTRAPELPVIVLTAQGSEKAAVQAMQAGAFDYQPKPCDQQTLLLSVNRALRHSELARRDLQASAERELAKPILGSSPAFRTLLEMTRRVAARDITVLVQGETGTGKELIASLLHAHSGRKHGPLVRFNCAAIAPNLAESELFGHEKGAFTGATSRHAGYFQQAHGGTLVLDEVGELPLELQPKLLRALQSGEVQPVGAAQTRHVDVRVVACTHRDLAAQCASGQFRQDLMYRLAVVTLRVPPLRERPEDVAVLANGLRRRYSEQFGLDDVPFTDAVVRALERHTWPGNVRELENCIAGWLATSADGSVDPAQVRLGDGAAVQVPTDGAASGGTLRERVRAFERSLLAQALEEAKGNHSLAARTLGITRTTLLDKLKRYALR